MHQLLRGKWVESHAGIACGDPAVANAAIQCRTVRGSKAALLRGELGLGQDRANLVCVRCVLSQPYAQMCDTRRGQVGIGEKRHNAPDEQFAGERYDRDAAGPAAL